MTSRYRSRPTVREVAALAGVSPATVSNVMNGTGRMATPTRARVLDAVRELGYSPWTSARAGERGGTGVVGLTLTLYGDHPVDYLEISYYRELVLGAMAEALRRGYLLLVLPSSLTSWAWMSTPLDGVVHSEPRADDPVREILLRRGIPMVSAGHPGPTARDELWVDSDTPGAMIMALDHLWENGSRRPALLLPQHDDAFPTQLLAGCEAWTARTGVAVRIAPFAPLPDYRGSETAAAAALLAGDDRPDGVVGVYEDSGHHVLDVADRTGLQVPHDLRVVCITDNPAYASTRPPLPCIALRANEIGRESVDLLIDSIHGRRRLGRHRLVPPRLVLHAPGTAS
ncbi:LacI family DNA-binding transcriptional regulator [Phycicoccus jejuensis]|uniref:LacI family DNA-binding transcriptional regulator n=1 Tax=Phycicoccus jejuensis TaxID=367299 RepID=UPI0004C3C66B|nr:LacI family DNA-binding transcriptional regulator [Phycicoccus jejuensis]